MTRAALSLLCRVFALAFVASAALPVAAADRHEGVASCASSLCHGATQPLGEHGIRQDEYFVWQRQDAHARAHLPLHGAKGRAMGTALGLDATTAPACLVCHSEVAAVRGERFQTSDGIGCEACHGGAERWLAEHRRPGITLAEKVSLGMQPLWQRETRAALCLGCHQGDAAHPITHAMMAAGHPKLLFELDSFTALEPPHHDRDADYAARKGGYEPLRDWLAGQARAAELHLTMLASPSLMQGLLPDFMAFDCTACHHRMDADRMLAARMPGAGAGALPFADADQQLLGFWLAVVHPAEAKLWLDALRRLNVSQAQGLSAVQASARASLQLLQTRIRPLIAGGSAGTPNELRALLRSLANDRTQARAPLFGEQRAMAMTVIGDALKLQGASLPPSASEAIRAYYAALRHVDAFEPGAHAAALAKVAAALP